MDTEVMRLGRDLAMCTLEVQLDYLYIALEEELRTILDGALPDASPEKSAVSGAALRQLAPRRGSTEELSLLLAQYALLTRRQAALRDVLSVRRLPDLFFFSWLLAQYALLTRRPAALRDVLSVRRLATLNVSAQILALFGLCDVLSVRRLP